MKIETTILRNLLQNEDYTRKVLPFLEEDYFTDNNEKIIYNHINEFVSNYSSLPSKEAIAIELSDEKINDEDYKTSVNLLNEISKESDEYTELGWLLDTTEKFCQDKAVYNAVVESIVFWIIQMLKKIKVQFLRFLVMPLVSVLILMWVMITLMMPMIGMIFITELKKGYHLILNTLTRLQMAVFPKRL